MDLKDLAQLMAVRVATLRHLAKRGELPGAYRHGRGYAVADREARLLIRAHVARRAKGGRP